MCGRLACTLNPDHLRGACSYLSDNQTWVKPQWLENKYTYKPFFNGPPTTILPVLAHRSNFEECRGCETSEYVLVPMRWSITPRWKTNMKGSYHTHNARAETLLTSPLYKQNVIEGRRCVVLADGYYEWQTTQGVTKHQPYFLYKDPWGYNSQENKWDEFQGWRGKYVMKLAGIFNLTKEQDGYTYSCSVITAESNKTLSWLHHRMPILCDFDYHVQKWLTKAYLGAWDVDKYLGKLCNLESPGQLSLRYHPVNPTYVNNSSLDDPKCMEAVDLNKSKTLDEWFGRKGKQTGS